MLIRKVKYKLSKLVGPIVPKSLSLNINWGYWVFTLICLFSIVLLGVNIFRIISKGYERYEIIQKERRRLEALIEKNLELREDLKYYSSKEYIDLKAREELNMAFPNQRLVYIEKDQEFDFSNNDNLEKQELKPAWRLWYDLIF